MRTPVAPAPMPETDPWTAWDRFLETTPATGFMQTSWWADFRVDAGYEHFGAILRHRGVILGGAVVMKLSWDDDTCFYYLPEGPVLPPDESAGAEVFEAILAAIEERRSSEQQTVSHLRIEPRLECLPGYMRGFQPVLDPGDPYTEPRYTLCVDLRPAEPEILAQMKSKGRYNIRVAQRHGVTVTEDTSSQGVADFLGIYDEMTVRQGLAAKPPEYFRAMVASLSALKKGSVFFAEYQGTRIAAAVVVYFGGRATYFFGASRGQHRQVMAPYLLHFEIMRRARALGCDWYDFWGVAPPGVENHPWSDISVFKRKFGGREVSLVPAMDHVYDPSAYARYVAGTRKDSVTERADEAAPAVAAA